MTDKPNQHRSDSSTARQNRLRAALRENLKRRKSQSRGRADQDALTKDDRPAAPRAADDEVS